MGICVTFRSTLLVVTGSQQSVCKMSTCERGVTFSELENVLVKFHTYFYCKLKVREVVTVVNAVSVVSTALLNFIKKLTC